MSSLDRLVSIVPPPPAPVGGSGSLPGVSLPRDYLPLLVTYGVGQFDEFLWLIAPAAPDKYLDLGYQRESRLDGLRYLAARGERVPYDIDALLPWAFSIDGDVCYWVTNTAADPDGWTVTVNEARGHAWEEFNGTATEFLVALFTGQVDMEVLPEPSDEPRFKPWRPRDGVPRLAQLRDDTRRDVI